MGANKRLGTLASFLPLLLAARLRFSETNDASAYLDLVLLCERFAFRVYALAEKRSNAGQSAMFSLAHRLFMGAATPAEVSAAIRWRALHHNPDDEFTENFASVGDWYSWSKLKYFLFEFELHLFELQKLKAPLDFTKLLEAKSEDSIEHILPQTPTAKYWLERFSAAERGKCTHDIGNLCLTFNNSSYGNKPFPEKKGEPGQQQPCYANSSLASERALAQKSEWTVATVLERRATMTAWAAERWRIDAPSVDESGGGEDEDEGE